MRNLAQFDKTLSLFFLAFLLCCCCLVPAKVVPDKLALLELKSSVSDPSGLISSWRIDGFNHCSWFGITCNSDSRVVSIQIEGGNYSNSVSCSKYDLFPFYGFGIRRKCPVRNGKLAGKLSPAIGKLTEIRVLSLPFHDIIGEIPTEIWGLRNLEVLDFEGNSISGYLPGELGVLKKLRVLNLGLNRIAGEIPVSLSECRDLRVLNLAGNEVNGSIPKFISRFPGLRGLYLSDNQLEGMLPDFGKSCLCLEHIDLSSNFISGEIPPSLGSCSKLRTLLLFSNLFGGIIPYELGRLKRLEVLDVSRNNLKGRIPDELGNCIELSVLVLSNVFDVSKVPRHAPLGRPSSTREENNHFHGSMPVKLTMLPKLRIFWAPKLNLEGKLLSSWVQCESLEMVNLAQNFFTGDISGLLRGCNNLHFLNLSSNRLSGRLDKNIHVPCMMVFDLSSNFISGSIPHFNNAACSHRPYLDPYPNQPHNPFFDYLSFFRRRTFSEISFPFVGTSLKMIHNFAGNKFTSSIPLLPVAPKRLRKINYACLAGGNKLSGPLFIKFSGSCKRLAALVVNVRKNRLYDHFPSELGGNCRSLIYLDVSKNHISGSIPQSIAHLRSLVLLDLSGNELSGINLKNLKVLLVNNNKLCGQTCKGFRNLRSLTKLNISFSNLSAPMLIDDHVKNCSRMVGKRSLLSCPTVSLNVATSNQPAASLSGNNNESGKSGLSSIHIASIISASIVAFVILTLAALFYCIRKWIPDSRVQVTELSESISRQITVFCDIGIPLTYESVILATGNFNAGNCIGAGGFGPTYKAEISPGILLAVKRLTIERCQGVLQFHAEISTLGRLRHPNLITLIGYHVSEAEMFLIYNYLPGGSLEKLIQERNQRALGWQILHKIALDIASALAYLHYQCNPRVIHLDVKPSNILLDNDFNAYLSDFGLSRLLETSESHAMTGVAGTYGYVAPDYALTCRVSEKADVYSYGVVLLELISDKRALDPSFSSHKNGFNIVSWARMLLQEDQVQDIFNANLWDTGPLDSLVKMLHLAILCTGDSLFTRPTMTEVVQQLEQLQHRPT
ncbi:Non-specific serine/threonine protein kinase [Bertholletia excelsa]